MDVLDDFEDPQVNNGHESPMYDEEGDTMESSTGQSEDSTSSDTGNTPCHSSKKKLQNILDKSISIDEDSLIAPLEPIRVSPIISNKSAHTLEMRPHLVSILRKASTCDGENAYAEDSDSCDEYRKKVSFPADDYDLTRYREPDITYPFSVDRLLSAQEILLVYQQSCKRNNTLELDSIKSQITEIKQNVNRSAALKLNGVSISPEVLETLEDLFKVANFSSISIIDCKFTTSLIADFLSILEYYECTTELIISLDLEELEAWKLFSNMAASSVVIESITFKNMTLSDVNMRMFMSAVTENTTVNTLKFDNCSLAKLPNFHLIDSLETNYTIRELYLPQTGLYAREADCISKLLTKNTFLKVLDISNNVIGDRGLEQLSRGLCKQTEACTGLSVLILFNNQLTEKSGKTLSHIIATCKGLRSLNVGFNKLTDAVINDIKDSLKMTELLEGIGLQSTVLTCIGAANLAEIIEVNRSLEKLNLKGNKAIYIEGLDKLSKALISSKIVKCDLDETNRSCADRKRYSELVTIIKGICTVNKNRAEVICTEEMSLSQRISHKISLNCEPYYSTPSHNITGPASRTRSRFHVSKVPDSCPNKLGSNSSRFKVVAVPSSSSSSTFYGTSDTVISISTVEEEYDEVQQFQNVRSSISSLESVDSPTLPTPDISYSPASPDAE